MAERLQPKAPVVIAVPSLPSHSRRVLKLMSAPRLRFSPRCRNGKSKRILLVEDHDDTNRSLTNLLRLRGYHVQSANNVQSAVDLSSRDEFDVLISDLGLPDGTGIDVIQRSRFSGPVFAIALTGFGMEDDVRKSHEAGFKHHLVKPIDLNKLDLLIQEAGDGEHASVAPAASR